MSRRASTRLLALLLVTVPSCDAPGASRPAADARAIGPARSPEAGPPAAAPTGEAAGGACESTSLEAVARKGRWAALARWLPGDLSPLVALSGTPPDRISRSALDPCLGTEASKYFERGLVLVLDRPGQPPYAHPVTLAGLNHLRGFMQPGRPGRPAASAEAVVWALGWALPEYLKGRSIAVTYPPLAGERRSAAGRRLRFVADPRSRAARVCTATAVGPLRYVDGYYPEGDDHGRPLGDRYQGFQVLFWERPRAAGVETGERYEPESLVRPKALLRGRCPGEAR
jgi:hypothetical protein